MNIMKRGKKAQGKVIAVVLLILLAILAVILLWNAIKGLLKIKTADFDSGIMLVSISTDKDFYVKSISGGNYVDVPVKRAAGEGKLVLIKIIFTNISGGTFEYINDTTLPGELETVIYRVSLGNFKPVSYQVYPLINHIWGPSSESSHVSNTDTPVEPPVTPPATCTDGLQNQDESDKDCGGTVCPKCGNTKSCNVNADCNSDNCQNNICTIVPSCTPDSCSNHAGQCGTFSNGTCIGSFTCGCPMGQACINSICTNQINSCRDITAPGYYQLSRSIITNATCFIISSDNVVLDGIGFNVTYKSGSLVGVTGSAVIPPYYYGVYANNVKNITVQNLGVYGFDGISISNVFDSTIKNNKVTTGKSCISIGSYNSGNARILVYNNAVTACSIGIDIYSVNDSQIINNTANACRKGIGALGANNLYSGNQILNQTLSSDAGIYGFYDNQTFIDNVICSPVGNSFDCSFRIPANTFANNNRFNSTNCGAVFNNGKIAC
jgi:hypothetical protein